MTQPIQEIDLSRIKNLKLKTLLWNLFSGKSAKAKNMRIKKGGIKTRRIGTEKQLTLPLDKPEHRERTAKDVKDDTIPPLPWKIQKKFFPSNPSWTPIPPWVRLNMTKDEWEYYKNHGERGLNETDSITVSELTNMIREVVNEVASDPDSNVKETGDKALDAIQLALDIAGIPPSIGTPVNAVNTIISLLRAAKDKEQDERKKHLIDAGLNAISMIPFASVVKLVKLRALRKPAVMAARAIKTGGEVAPRSYEPGVVQEDGEWYDSEKKDRKKEILPMDIDPTKIQAGKSQGFWLSPIAKLYQVGVSHAEFAIRYMHPELGNGAFDAMFREGWVRLRSHPEQKILEIEFLRSTPEQRKVKDIMTKVLKYRTYVTKHKKHMEEGAGWGTTKDIKKDPKHIDDPKTGKMERWRIKFQSANDLKKHGNTEKSPVNEGKEPKPLSPEAIAAIQRSMQRKGTRPTAKRLVDIMLSGPLMGLTSNDLADTAIFANGLDAIEEALTRGDFQGAINIAKETSEEMIRDEGGGGILGGEDDLGETVTRTELKEMIKGLVNEMWVGWEQQNEAVDDFELGKQKAIADFKNKVPYKKNPVGLSARWIEGYRWAYGTLRRAAERGTGAQTTERPERDSQADFGLGEGEEYDKWLSSYKGQECPKCKTFHKPGSADLRTLNPSNPTIHQCKCGHKWNPDNVKKQ